MCSAALPSQQLGRQGLPEGRIAETWEVSDVDGDIAIVTEGPRKGGSLRELTLQHPDLPFQPVFQYYFNPGGNGRRPDAVMLGIRSKAIF